MFIEFESTIMLQTLLYMSVARFELPTSRMHALQNQNIHSSVDIRQRIGISFYYQWQAANSPKNTMNDNVWCCTTTKSIYLNSII